MPNIFRNLHHRAQSAQQPVSLVAWIIKQQYNVLTFGIYARVDQKSKIDTESNTKLNRWMVKPPMKRSFIEIGVCGLSCRLCPAYNMETKSKCEGCKSEYRMSAACPFHNCVKKKGMDFCGSCHENTTCARWRKHKELSRQHDSFVCYQKLEDNIASIQKNGMEEFEKQQKASEWLRSWELWLVTKSLYLVFCYKGVSS